MKIPFLKVSHIGGKDGVHDTVYQSRFKLGRIRLHIFYRGDLDPDCHDHPFDFWTFPLTPYIEEYVNDTIADRCRKSQDGSCIAPNGATVVRKQLIRAFRITFRKAEHTHRILGRWDGHHYDAITKKTIWSFPLRNKKNFWLKFESAIAQMSMTPLLMDAPIVTIVWQSKPRREWGFLTHNANMWQWVPWKKYIFGENK